MALKKIKLQFFVYFLVVMGIFQYYYSGYGDFNNILLRRHTTRIQRCLRDSDFACVRFLSEKHIKEHPNNAIGYYYHGLADAGDWEYPAAVEYFSKAIELDKSYRDAYYERAKAYFVLSDTQKALRDINKAIALDKYRPDFYELRAEYLLSAKKRKEALRDYIMAAKLYRNVSNKIDALRVESEIARLKEQYQL